MSYTASYIVNSSSAQGTTDFQFTFPYIKEEHIEVYLNYSKITQGSGSNQYQVITNVSPKLIRLNTGIASANLRVEVRRNSSLDNPLVDYADGSTLTANDLDTSALQSLYIDQELKDNQSRTVVVDETTGLPELNSQKLTNVADPTAAQDAATKNYVDTKVFTSSQIQDGTLVNADISASAAIAGSKLQAATGGNSGSLSAADKTKLDNVETAATADQTNAEIRAAVEAASDSNVFTDADHTKLNAIEANATADQTNAEIRAAVEAASDSNVFTDADHSKLDGIDSGAKDDQTASEIKSLIATSPLDASHLDANSVGDSEISTGALDNRYYTETELDAGQLDNRYYTETEADSRFYNLSSGEEIQSGETWSAADNKIATTAAIDARITDLVDDVGGFVPIVNETSFPAANPDVNNGAGTLVSVKEFASSHTPSGGNVTIANGAGSGNTVTITGCGSTVLAAGFGGIVETTSTLHTYTFHRLTPKATEVTTVAGNVTNINAVANNATNINTVAGNNTNINTVAGNNANITTVAGINSNVTSVAGNSTNINAVNSNSSNINTVAGSISNVNTTAGSISNVNTVATNISNVNDFSDKYRVASSDPSSNNDTGDLVFNTTSNELRVYNGSTWQGGVTATGNLASLGSNTFTGAQTFVAGQTFDGRDVSADGAKLDGIASGAEVNVKSDWNATTGDAQILNKPAIVDSTKMPIAGGTFTGDVTFTGDTYDLVWDKSDNALELEPQAKLKIGNNTEIFEYSSGGNFQISSTGSYNLQFDANGGDNYFSQDGMFTVENAAHNSTRLKAKSNGVELYASGTKRLDVTTSGATITGACTATSFAGVGSSLTALSASELQGSLPAISGASLTSLPAANLTGTLPTISGANLTNLNASNINQGQISSSLIPTLNQDTSGNAEKNTVLSTANNQTFKLLFTDSDGTDKYNYVENQSGQAEYNPGTNTLTIGNYVGDGSGLTNLPASGGTVDLYAHTSNIATGKAVFVNSSGKVEEVTGSTTAETPSVDETLNQYWNTTKNTSYGISTAICTISSVTYIVIVFNNQTNNSYANYIVGKFDTTNPKTISWGSITQFDDATMYQRPEVVAMGNTGRFVLTSISQGYGQAPRFFGATINTSNLSLTINSGQSEQYLMDDVSNIGRSGYRKTINMEAKNDNYCFFSIHASDNYGYMLQIKWDGSTFDASSSQACLGTTLSVSNDVCIGMSYNPDGTGADNGYVLTAWRNGGDTRARIIESPPNNLTFSSCSGGSFSDNSYGFCEYSMQLGWISNTSCFVSSIDYVNSWTHYEPAGVILYTTNGGTTLSSNNWNLIQHNQNIDCYRENNMCIWDSTTSRLLIQYNNSSTNQYYCNSATVSGNTITLGTEVEQTSQSGLPTAGQLHKIGRHVYMHPDSNNTYYIKPMHIGGGGSTNRGWVDYLTSASNSHNGGSFIGITSAAINANAEGTINVAGSVNNQVSGLTAGSVYYLGVGGALSTSSISPATKVGVALASNKILIGD